jgi:glutathione synthase/RimK-type ligase-like ATP-grasp enzyme
MLMILVAGGQLDFNIGVLLRRILQRRVRFIDIVVGPQLVPELTIDLDRDELCLNGEPIRPTACFMRHDAFLSQRSKSPHVHAAAANWYYAVKGWELAHDDVKGFNKRASAVESNKLQNLYLAKHFGLAVPETIVTNAFARAGAVIAGAKIQKPAAGGEHTTSLARLRKELAADEPLARYPRFVQERLKRPEMRVYRIGDVFIAFLLHAKEVDYRELNRVRIEPAKASAEIETKLRALTDALGLDFAAADFMLNKQNDYCFLEVNTQPMFSAFDAVAGGRICDAIIDHLAAP